MHGVWDQSVTAVPQHRHHEPQRFCQQGGKQYLPSAVCVHISVVLRCSRLIVSVRQGVLMHLEDLRYSKAVSAFQTSSLAVNAATKYMLLTMLHRVVQ